MNEAAQVPQVALPGCVQYRTGAQKQQAFHERMIHCVIHDGNQRERRRCAHPDACEYDRKAKAGKHDPDVFDGGIGQQTFHVGLCRGEDNPIQRAEEPEESGNRPHHHSG